MTRVPGTPYPRGMLHARAEVATPAPDRYIRQLVSHLGHKIATEMQADGSGVIAVEDGRCTLTAGTELLVLEASADSAEGLAHIQDVVGRHLERFGARADLRVDWRHDGSAAQA
jgi:caffeoyl-CoA O-methyltransferase